MTASDPLPSVPPEKPMSELDKEIEAAKRRTLEGFTRVVDTVSASPLPEEQRECPACGTKLIPASQAFSEIRERITAEEPPAPDDLVFPGREMTPEDLAALRVRPEEPPALKALLDELLETRRHIASGGCASFDEAAYFAEVENDVRWRVEALFASLSSQLERQREEIQWWQDNAKQTERVILKLDAHGASLEAQIECLKAEQPSSRLSYVVRDFLDYTARVQRIDSRVVKNHADEMRKALEACESALRRLSQSDTGAHQEEER